MAFNPVSLCTAFATLFVRFKGDHVDGIYNQDLALNMVLIELGGIENTQEEINRTISLLAKAISIVLQNQSSVTSI